MTGQVDLAMHTMTSTGPAQLVQIVIHQPQVPLEVTCHLTRKGRLHRDIEMPDRVQARLILGLGTDKNLLIVET